MLPLLLLLAMGKQRVKRKKLGYALNFCPVCRGLTCCRATELKLLAGMGEATQRVSHEMKCTQCATPVEVQGRPVTGSKQPVEDTRAGLEGLLSDEAGPLRARVELERRAASSQLSPVERRDLIAEPFILLEYALRERTTTGARRALSQLIQLGLMVAMGCALIGWLLYRDQHGIRTGGLLAFCLGSSAGAAVLTGLVIQRAVTGWRTVAARQCLPRIAQSLAALRPSPAELEQALTSLRGRGLKIAKSIEVSQLELAMTMPMAGVALAA